jgi:hypothetical protein
LSAHREVLEIIVFGTISPDIYHDLIWERIQALPEYAKHEAGIYEVRRLPDLKFFISFQGLDLDLTYRQEAELVRT